MSLIFPIILTIMGVFSVVVLNISKNQFTVGDLRLLATGLVSSAITGLFYAVWQLILELNFLNITDPSIRELPGNIFMFMFFLSMMFNSYNINQLKKMYGFSKIKKK